MHRSVSKTGPKQDERLNVTSLVQGQKHLGGVWTEINAGLTAHPHDVLEAVEARAASTIHRLAVVCPEHIFHTLHEQTQHYLSIFLFTHL